MWVVVIVFVIDGIQTLMRKILFVGKGRVCVLADLAVTLISMPVVVTAIVILC